MKSHVLLTVWCHISCEAAGEFWHWSLSGVKGLNSFWKLHGEAYQANILADKAQQSLPGIIALVLSVMNHRPTIQWSMLTSLAIIQHLPPSCCVLLWQGVLSCRGRKVLMVDADGATKFSDLSRLMDSLETLTDAVWWIFFLNLVYPLPPLALYWQ